jgi:hypothetical protein
MSEPNNKPKLQRHGILLAVNGFLGGAATAAATTRTAIWFSTYSQLALRECIWLEQGVFVSLCLNQHLGSTHVLG